MTLFSTLFEFCTLRCKRGQILSADGTTINITTTTDNTHTENKNNSSNNKHNRRQPQSKACEINKKGKIKRKSNLRFLFSAFTQYFFLGWFVCLLFIAGVLCCSYLQLIKSMLYFVIDQQQQQQQVLSLVYFFAHISNLYTHIKIRRARESRPRVQLENKHFDI